MTYIINPSWVYWLNVLNVIHITAAIVAVLSGIFCGGLIIALLFTYEDYVGTDTYTKLQRVTKIFSIVFITTLLGAIFIPSSETMLTMKIAELATKENVSLTVQQLEEIVDYIIEAIKSLKG